MDRRYKPIHEFWNVFEMWRQMIANINWLFTKTPAKLRDVRDGNVIQRPKRIFIKGGKALFQAYFDAVGQQIILPEKILFLHKVVELAVVTFGNNHAKKEPANRALSF